MNREIIEGSWTEFKGVVKERWGRFTRDNLEQIAGRRYRILGREQKNYGYAKEEEEAERELDKFEE